MVQEKETHTVGYFSFSNRRDQKWYRMQCLQGP